jgi:hypothetical protein
MLAFIDESGDPGLKIGKGSTKYFVLSMVYFEEDQEAIECDHKIKSQESHKNNLLQLADIIVGSTAKTVSESLDKDIYRNIIKIKEIQIKTFPPK